MGGTLPPFIEVRSPAMETRLKIDIPRYESADIKAAYAVFTPSNIIALCQESLRAIPEYQSLVEKHIKTGKPLDLAWRTDTVLDWVWQLEDAQGKYRDWAVLCGLALRQVS